MDIKLRKKGNFAMGILQSLTMKLCMMPAPNDLDTKMGPLGDMAHLM